MRSNRESRRRVRTRIVPAGVVLTMALGACGSAGDPTADAVTPVMATTSVLADITANVGCGDIEVESIVPIGVDAHSYEPTVRDADRVRAASVIISNGLGLEEGLNDTLAAAVDSGADVYEVGPNVDPQSVDGRVDPHVWTDPDRMAAAVPAIAEQLKAADGVDLSDERIDDCAQDYRTTLEALSADMDETLAVVPEQDRKLVTNHEALTYFADRFGFEVIGAVIPSTSSLGEPNARALDELAAAMKANGVTTVFGEVTGAKKVAESLTDRLGESAQVVELYTESLGASGTRATTYVDMMTLDAQLVADALAPGGSPTSQPPVGQ